MEPLRVLHLSDLHVRADADVEALLQPLAADLRDPEGLGVDRLDHLVISGDLTNRATPSEFEQARRFVSGLVERFQLPPERCTVVPGNHDLSWDEPVYQYKAARQVDPRRLEAGSWKPEGGGYLVRDDAQYPARFANFARSFHQPLLQQKYPLAAAEQGLSFLFADEGLQLLALNSAWQIDEHFKERSSIHDGALSRCLARADEQVAAARAAGQLATDCALLRIAVWHHPVTGNEKIVDDAFLERLRAAGVALCLHGHVHEDRADLVGYLHPTRQLHVLGAGSFGAPAEDRPPSTPQLYNLLEIDRIKQTIRVHTRQRPRQGGAWRGWAVWPGATRHEQRTYYEISLPRSAARPASTVAAIPTATADAPFDVFFCYNRRDHAQVAEIARRLEERGLRPWLDEAQIRPGESWQKALEQQIRTTRSGAVFVGESGIGPWQDLEQEALLRQLALRRCPIIPVLLGDSRAVPELPLFLEGMQWVWWVDLRLADPDPIDQLVWGITGQRTT